MTQIPTPLANLTFVEPDPIAHAPITLSWFESEYGRETLLLMGNAEHEITSPSLASERRILEEFVELRRKAKQLTWMLQFEGKIIGVAWIELVKNHNVLPPSVHLMIGDKKYRGRGLGKATMRTLVQYIQDNIATHAIYSRHLASNIVVANMNRRLGFMDDGAPYTDSNLLEWQNVKLSLEPSSP